jgi:hypothetical protein
MEPAMWKKGGQDDPSDVNASPIQDAEKIERN